MKATPHGALRGEIRVPGDKSISHRSLILGAMTVGETRISELLEGQDVLDTAEAMRAFGAEVVNHGNGDWSVHGVGVGGFAEPERIGLEHARLSRSALRLVGDEEHALRVPARELGHVLELLALDHRQRTEPLRAAVRRVGDVGVGDHAARDH